MTCRKRWMVLGSVALAVVAAGVQPAAAQSSADRSGFTLLVDLGAGFQKDAALEDSGIGIGGANLGIGGFLTPDIAIMGRVSGTRVGYDGFSQISGVAAPVIQFWPDDMFNLRAGAGLGLWSVEDESDMGFGLILGAGITVFNNGRHNLQVGFEYSPVFTEPGTVHNIGITFGYQFQ